MRRYLVIGLGLAALAVGAKGYDGLFDRIDDALTVELGEDVRARLSGTIDLEFFRVEQPAPGLLFTRDRSLFNPRLTLFLDVQLGAHVYVFAQGRIDRGYDPGDGGTELRLDEYAVRYTPWSDGRFNIQIGKFSTVVGIWTKRHGSWENPFINAPLAYEGLTAIWDSQAPGSSATLLRWAHLRPVASPAEDYADKHLRLPVIWGPNYATGVAVSGRVGSVYYAAEMKNSSLSSRPESWEASEVGWDHPTFSGRLGYHPSPTWNFGVSYSSGTYLYPSAKPTLAPGRGLGEYRQIVFAQDVSFAWRHWQVWAEAFETRFEIPRVGDAGVVSYYVEAKYKFAPQFSGAIRWNQDFFGKIPDVGGSEVRWGRDRSRIDVAPTYRLNAHTQLKLQYSLQRERNAVAKWNHLWAAQFTVRF